MKKITIVTVYPFYGGIERFVTTLANMLAEDNEVSVICLYGRKGEWKFPLGKSIKIEYLIKNAPEMISLKELIARRKVGRIASEMHRRFKISADSRAALKNALSALRSDIVITERTLMSKYVGKYCNNRTKKIATDHNYHQNDKKYIEALLRSLRGFEYLVVATDELYSFYKNKIGTTKCVKIPNPLGELPTVKSSLEHKNLIAVGRLSPEKGFDDLVKVFGLVHEKRPDTKLFLIGDGMEWPRIRRLVDERGLSKSIIMPGFLNQKEIEKYYRQSSIYVMTSHTEAFGLVLAEAMSHGLPCVAFDSASGARELLGDGTGILVKRRSCNDMASKIIKLLDTTQERKVLSRMSLKKVQGFSSEKIASSWQNIVLK